MYPEVKEFLDEKGWVVPLGDVKGWEEKKGFVKLRREKSKTKLFWCPFGKRTWSLELKFNEEQRMFCKTLGDFIGFLDWPQGSFDSLLQIGLLGISLVLGSSFLFFKGYFVTFRIFIDFNFHEVFRFLECFKGRQTESSNLNNSNYLPTKSCPPPPLKQTNIIRSRKWTARSEFRWGVQSRQKVFITEGAIILSSHHRKSFDHCPDPTKF